MKIFTLLACLLGLAACTNDSHSQQTQTPMYKDLSAKEFKAKFEAASNAVVLDVRTPQEVAEGKIAGSTNIDIFNPNFAAQIDKLDKSKAYYVYCRSGKRSANACQIMAQKGFKEIYNLDGGYMAWEVEF